MVKICRTCLTILGFWGFTRMGEVTGKSGVNNLGGRPSDKSLHTGNMILVDQQVKSEIAVDRVDLILC